MKIQQIASAVKRWSKEWNIPAWAALVVSVYAITYAREAANHSYVQSEILKHNNLPYIEVVETSESNSSFDAGFLSSSVIMKNVGGPLKNFQAEAISVLIVSSPAILPKWLEVPVSGYYLKPIFTGRTRGTVARFLGGTGNVSKFSKLFLEIDTSNLYIARVETLFEIAYSDALDAQHTEYYRVASGLETQSTTAHEWNTLSERSKQISIPIEKMDLSEVTRVFADLASKTDLPAHPQWIR